MKNCVLDFTIVLVANALLACFVQSQDSNTIRSVETKSATVPFRSLLKKTAPPNWIAVDSHGLTLMIPYSEEWKISDVGLSVFEYEVDIDGTRILRFGRPVDAGTYITREYRLVRQPRRKFAELLTELTSSLDKATEIISIGNLRCIKFYECGAKGCTLGFATNIGKYTYRLYRVWDFGESMPAVDQETETIIERIQKQSKNKENR